MTSDARSPATNAAVRLANSIIDTSGANCLDASSLFKIADLSTSPGACLIVESLDRWVDSETTNLEIYLVFKARHETWGNATGLCRSSKDKYWISRKPPRAIKTLE